MLVALRCSNPPLWDTCIEDTEEGIQTINKYCTGTLYEFDLVRSSGQALYATSYRAY